MGGGFDIWIAVLELIAEVFDFGFEIFLVDGDGAMDEGLIGDEDDEFDAIGEDEGIEEGCALSNALDSFAEVFVGG